MRQVLLLFNAPGVLLGFALVVRRPPPQILDSAAEQNAKKRDYDKQALQAVLHPGIVASFQPSRKIHLTTSTRIDARGCGRVNGQGTVQCVRSEMRSLAYLVATTVIGEQLATD